MKNVLKEIFEFLKKPTDEQFVNQSFQNKFQYIGKILALDLAFNVILYWPLFTLIDKIVPIVEESTIYYKLSKFFISVLLIGMLIPIMEEIVFRLLLRYNKLFSFVISREKWNKYFPYLVYISILAFGFAHSTNYLNDSLLFYLLLPVIVLTQAVGGVFLAFLRVRFNIYTSIAFHAIFNSFILLAMYIWQFFEKPYIIEDDNKKVKIEYLSFRSSDEQQFEIDSLNGKIFQIKITDYSINHVYDSLFQIKNMQSDFLFNMELESKQGLSKKEVQDIFDQYIEEEN